MWTRVKNSFKGMIDRASQGIQGGWSRLFYGKSLEDVDWNALEETLLSADVGVAVTQEILEVMRTHRGPMEEMENHVIDHLRIRMEPFEKILHPAPVVLLVGVNGSGKTTTLGKLAALWQGQGQRVHIIAGDTFRAGAVDQLGVWAKNFPLTTGGTEPASVVYTGLVQAKEGDATVVLIDTAGRLPHQVGLMDQMKKIHGIIQRLRPEETCEIILTLDATVGQHALVQIEAFKKCLPLTGLIMNKMDGTAKGGILLNIGQKYGLPIYGVGVGEGVEDVQPFSAESYAKALWGKAD